MRCRNVEEIVLAYGICARIQIRAVARTRTPVPCDVSPLCVVEDVERLCPKFEAYPLRDGEMFKQRHIEVGPVRIVQDVSSRSAEGQATRHGKRVRVEEQGAEAGQWNLDNP